MPRITYHLPALLLLFTASLVLLLVSLSLPRFPALDLVRVYFDSYDSLDGGAAGGGHKSAPERDGMGYALAELRVSACALCGGGLGCGVG